MIMRKRILAALALAALAPATISCENYMIRALQRIVNVTRVKRRDSFSRAFIQAAGL